MGLVIRTPCAACSFQSTSYAYAAKNESVLKSAERNLNMTMLARSVLTVLLVSSSIGFEFKTAQDKSYRYGFQVTNKDEGNEFSHQQDVEHGQTSGEYRIHLPDGRWQIVSYIADDRGYRAVVRYEEPNNPLGAPPPATWGFNPRDPQPSPLAPQPNIRVPYPDHQQVHVADPEAKKYGPPSRPPPRPESYSHPERELADRSPTGGSRHYSKHAEHPDPSPGYVNKDTGLHNLDRNDPNSHTGHPKPYYEQPSFRYEPYRDFRIGRLPSHESIDPLVTKPPLQESDPKVNHPAKVPVKPDPLPKSRWRFPDEEPKLPLVLPQVNTFVIHPTPPVRPLRLFPLEPFLEPNIEHWQPLNPLLAFALQDNIDLEPPKHHTRPGKPILKKDPHIAAEQEPKYELPEVKSGIQSERYGPDRPFQPRDRFEQEDSYRKPDTANNQFNSPPTESLPLPPRSQYAPQPLPPKQRPPMYNDGIRLLYGIAQSADGSIGQAPKNPDVPSVHRPVSHRPTNLTEDPGIQHPTGLSHGRLSHLRPVFVPAPPEIAVDHFSQVLERPNLFEEDALDHPYTPLHPGYPKPYYFQVNEQPSVWLKPHGDVRYTPSGYKPKPHRYHESTLNSTLPVPSIQKPGGDRPPYDIQPHIPGDVNYVGPNVYASHRGTGYPTVVFHPTSSTIDPNLEGEAPTESPSKHEIPDGFSEEHKENYSDDTSSKPYPPVTLTENKDHPYPYLPEVPDQPTLQHEVESFEHWRPAGTNPPQEDGRPIVNPTTTSAPPLSIKTKPPATQPYVRPTTKPSPGPAAKPVKHKPVKHYSSGSAAHQDKPAQPVTEKEIDLLQLYPFPGSGSKGNTRPGQRVSKIPTASITQHTNQDEIQKAQDLGLNQPSETPDPGPKHFVRPGRRFQIKKKPKINFAPKGPFPSPNPRPAKPSNDTEEGSLLAKYPLRPKRPNFSTYGHRVRPLKRLNEQTGRVIDIDLRSSVFDTRTRTPVEDDQAIVFPESEEFVEGVAPVKPQEAEDDSLEGEPPLESESSDLAGRIPSPRPNTEVTSPPVLENPAVEFLFELPEPPPPPVDETFANELFTEEPGDIISFDANSAPAIESKVQDGTTPSSIVAVTTDDPEVTLFAEVATTETPTTEAPSTTAATTTTTTTTRRPSFVPRFRTTSTTTTSAPSSSSTRRNRVTFRPRNRTRLPAPVSRKIPNVVILDKQDQENRADNKTSRAFKFPPRIRFLQTSERVTRDYPANVDLLNQTDFSTVTDELTESVKTSNADDAPGENASREEENELGQREDEVKENVTIAHELPEKTQPAMLRLQPFELFLLPPIVTESVGTSNIRYPTEPSKEVSFETESKKA